MRSDPLIFFIHTMLLLVVFGCGPAAQDQTDMRPSGLKTLPNVVLITIDTLRADHCSCYGYARETTPRLDMLASEGVRFEVAYSPMPTTAPTHATLFTGHYPMIHGVIKNGYVLDEGFMTLTEQLKSKGYETAAFVSSFVVDSKFGLGQGFDHYDDDFSGSTSSFQRDSWEGFDLKGEHFDRRANETTDNAIAWLESRKAKQNQNRDTPFFMWVHYFDPHNPFDPPEPYASRFSREDLEGTRILSPFDTSAYDGEILFADHEMGRFIDYLDASFADHPPLIGITSDHGEGLMQHGYMGHGLYLYEEAVRAVLVFRWKGMIPAGRVVKHHAMTSDLMPTTLALLGLGGEAGPLQGSNLSDWITGSATNAQKRPIFLQRRHFETDMYNNIPIKGKKFGLQEGQWKYIAADEEQTEELYNLKHDPHELKNIVEIVPKKRTYFKKKLNGFKTFFEKHARSGAQKISDEDQSNLEALGYVK